MRFLLVILGAGIVSAQQPILYTHGTVNAASLAPFGLPNGPIARGSVFRITGENLGPVQTQTASAYPLAAELNGVSISVTQKGVVTPARPISISSKQIFAVMPSTVKAGLATLRVTYQSTRSNAITIQLSDAAPGLFSVSGPHSPLISHFLPVSRSRTMAPPRYTLFGTMGATPPAIWALCSLTTWPRGSFSPCSC